jgi:biopolymer transport protein ExbB
MDIEQALQAFTALGARWVLWLLGGLSVVGVAIIIERGVFLLASRDNVERLQKRMRELLALGQVERARSLLEASPCFEARVAAAGLAADGAGSAEERMAGEAQWIRLRMEQRLNYLGTLGNNAPFVGLLGTVIGIIGAFHELGAGMGQVSAGLMAEIGEALVATAVGLLVALPAVASYNVFQRAIKVRLARADALGREVLAHFKDNLEARVAPGE